jgi:predicted restriction endonuclease
MKKYSYNVVSDRQHRTHVLFDTVFINHDINEVHSLIKDNSKVKKIEEQNAKHDRIVIRWNSLINTLSDINEELGFINYPRKQVIG